MCVKQWLPDGVVGFRETSGMRIVSYFGHVMLRQWPWIFGMFPVLSMYNYMFFDDVDRHSKPIGNGRHDRFFATPVAWQSDPSSQVIPDITSHKVATSEQSWEWPFMPWPVRLQSSPRHIEDPTLGNMVRFASLHTHGWRHNGPKSDGPSSETMQRSAWIQHVRIRRHDHIASSHLTSEVPCVRDAEFLFWAVDLDPVRLLH